LQLSIVIPLFNEEESLPELHAWISKVTEAENISREIIFIDDGSTDKSWEIVKSLCEKDPQTRGIRFRRNHGKSAALNIGFRETLGEVVITMDADLQDSPDEIPELVRLIREDGFDLISGWKQKRYDPITKTLPTKLFNWAARKSSGIYLHDFNCGLKAYRGEVVHNIEVQGEMHRYIPILAKSAGYKNIGEKVVQHQARKYGTTKFGWERFINGFLDLLTLSFVSRFAKRPMHFFGLYGVLMFGFGFISALYIGASKLFRLHQGLKTILVTDSPWFYIALTSMLLGTMLFLTGFLAELIVRSSSKKEHYTVGERINLKDA
jgi:glycosyltransferase involved in cell wall biosynthesis